jgi:hypothetical protein
LILARRALGIPLDVLAMGLGPLQPILTAAEAEVLWSLRPVLDLLGVGSMFLAWAVGQWGGDGEPWPSYDPYHYHEFGENESPARADDWWIQRVALSSLSGAGGWFVRMLYAVAFSIVLARYLCAGRWRTKGRGGLLRTFFARVVLAFVVVAYPSSFPVSSLAMAAILAGPSSGGPRPVTGPLPQRLLSFLFSLFLASVGSAVTPLWPLVLGVVGAADLWFL